MMTFWCDAAVLPDGPTAAVRIHEVDGVIARITVGVPREAGDVHLDGVTLPGLANGHSHAFHRVLRGTTHNAGGTFWTWRTAMYAVAHRIDPDTYRALAHAVFVEMLLAGYTVVGEFHYVHGRPGGDPYPDAEMERAVLDAAAAAGIRITLLDTLYLTGGLDDSGRELPQSPEQRRFGDGSVDGWATRRGRLEGTATARVGAALHSLRSVPPTALAAFRERTRGEPVHAHLSEQPAENAQVLAAYGRTPTAVLEDAGFLDEHFTAVHATHLQPDDVHALRRGFVCLCPTTERDLADGIGRARALANAGARLTLGSDQHAVIDPFEELRGMESHERLLTGSRGRFSPTELLSAGTEHGYASLGWRGGVLREGALCDLVTVDHRSARTAGSDLDQLWMSAIGADVQSVVVHGRLIVSAGAHPAGDVGALLTSAIGRIRG